MSKQGSQSQFTAEERNVAVSLFEEAETALEEECESEAFLPFYCRKCGNLVTNPYEDCPAGKQF